MLRTKRPILRCGQADDLDDMFAIYSNVDVMRYWSTPPHRTPSETAQKLDRIAQQPADAIRYFMIEMQGRVVGTAGLHKVDEIGFILHPDVWRQGVVTEAMTAIIPHLFNTFALPQLTADADPLNTASVQCLKSLGFQETGRAKDTFCIDGQWSNSVYFAMPRPQ